MSQLSLFATGPRVLLDDASGRIDYVPDVVEPARARVWFERLRDEMPWKHRRRMMYERELDVPRLGAWYELDDPALPPLVAEITAIVRGVVDAPFTSVGMNLYRDRHDSVAPHNDRLSELVRGQPIVLLSLGHARQMVIRSKQPPARVLKVDMEPGSLLTMNWDTQLHYDHAIPKQRTDVGPRISLAYRVRPRTG